MDGEGATEAGGGAGVIAVWLDRHRQKYECATRHPFVLSIREGTVDLSSFKRWLGRCGSVGHNQMSYLKRKKCALPGKIIDWRPGAHSIMSEREEMAILQMQELKDMRTVAYGQDYIFVREFVPFLASVLLKACKESDNGMDMEVILGGLASLHDELSWFKKEASKWDVHLAEVVPQRANRDYCSFLHSLTISEMDYTTAIVAFWAIETVYQESFALCLEDGSRTPAELLGTCERWGNTGFRRYCQSLREIAERRLQKAPDGVLRKAGGAFTQVLEHEVNFWNMSSGDT